VVIGNSREGIQNTVEELIKIGKDIGLTINSGQIKYMMVKRGGGDHNNLHVKNNTFEQVQEFKYLGPTLNNQNNMHGEINIRLGAANRRTNAQLYQFYKREKVVQFIRGIRIE